MLARCVEGEYGVRHIPITSVVDGALDELKRVDDRFFVMLNRKTDKFEVHVRGQRGTTLGCELPFERVDARMVPYVRALMRPMSELDDEIQRENQRLDELDTHRRLDRSNYKMKNALLWSDRHPSNETEIPKELVSE